MEIEISVKRQAAPDKEAYLQKFRYTGDGSLTVADWLTEINQTETRADRISWECGCLEKKCGACAMLINGCPALACSQFLKDVGKRGKITLEVCPNFLTGSSFAGAAVMVIVVLTSECPSAEF